MRFLRRPKPASPDERTTSLERRVSHLESMIEGLQDAVHREALRNNARLEEMEKHIEPAELRRRLSQDERERGL
jgi:uncharacterized coiled-coil protein SlyX